MTISEVYTLGFAFLTVQSSRTTPPSPNRNGILLVQRGFALRKPSAIEKNEKRYNSIRYL